MSKTAPIPRRDSLPARHVVTALSADELLETLRALVPDLRDGESGGAAADAGAVVIRCGAGPRATGAARHSRPSAVVLGVEPGQLVERFGLSGRQAEVARLLAAGHSNAEIAERLGLSTYTARNHAARVLHKLGIRRRSGVGLAILADEPPAAG
jgi:DNA-binding CsgD family transcriptional regulator